MNHILNVLENIFPMKNIIRLMIISKIIIPSSSLFFSKFPATHVLGYLCIYRSYWCESHFERYPIRWVVGATKSCLWLHWENVLLMVSRSFWPISSIIPECTFSRPQSCPSVSTSCGFVRCSLSTFPCKNLVHEWLSTCSWRREYLCIWCGLERIFIWVKPIFFINDFLEIAFILSIVVVNINEGFITGFIDLLGLSKFIIVKNRAI